MQLDWDSTVIKLTNNVHKWYCNDTMVVKGHGFLNGKLYANEKLLELFSEVNTKEDANSLCKELDGFFSIIIRLGDEVFVAVDHLRSFPLFYRKQGAVIEIFDSVFIGSIQKDKIDDNVLRQFSASLNVIGKKTIYSDIFQVQSGESVVFYGDKISTKKYWYYAYNLVQTENELEALQKLKGVYYQSFRQLVEQLNGRTAVVPLSGGHDSRLICYYLKKLEYKNIIAFTYGHKNNEESRISREVAKTLEIPHYFIEYSHRKCRSLFKKEFSKFARFASNAVSIPVISSWCAVKELLERKIIDENSVLIPGYSGDFLAGSHLLNDLPFEDLNEKILIDCLLEKHFTECADVNKPKLKNISEHAVYEVIKQYNLPRRMTFLQFNEAFERYNLEERQAKFIQNAVRLYEYLGLQWVTPLFYKNQFSVWACMSNTLRISRKIFFDFEYNEYPLVLKGICFASENPKNKVQAIVKKLGRIISPNAAHLYFAYLPRKYFYHFFLEKMIRKIKYGVNYFISKEFQKEIM